MVSGSVMQRARHKDGFYRLKNFCDRPEILGQSEHERVTQWARRHADGSHLVPPMSVKYNKRRLEIHTCEIF